MFKFNCLPLTLNYNDELIIQFNYITLNLHMKLLNNHFPQVRMLATRNIKRVLIIIRISIIWRLLIKNQYIQIK